MQQFHHAVQDHRDSDRLVQHATTAAAVDTTDTAAAGRAPTTIAGLTHTTTCVHHATVVGCDIVAVANAVGCATAAVASHAIAIMVGNTTAAAADAGCDALGGVVSNAGQPQL